MKSCKNLFTGKQTNSIMTNNASSHDDDYFSDQIEIDNPQCTTTAVRSNFDIPQQWIHDAETHELIRVVPGDQTVTLEPGTAFDSKWKELNKAANRSNSPTTTNEQRETTTSARDESIFVVSVIGDTACGKSFLVDKLLDERERNRPVVIDDRVRNGSTTGNILCYESASFIPNCNDAKSLLLDFEGERSSSIPRLLRRLWSSLTQSQVQKRCEAVEKYFPTLAYTLSNVIILISQDDFVNVDYVLRCYNFAKRATDNLQQNPYKPVLILVQNRYAGLRSLSIKEVTDEFFQIHPDCETGKLKNFFERVICLRLPEKSNWSSRNNGLSNEGTRFDVVITNLKSVLANIQRKHIEQRCLSYVHWLMVTRLVIDAVSSNKIVSMHMLLRQAIIKDGGDVTETLVMFFFQKLYSKQDIHCTQWFRCCRQFAVEILKHTIASRLLQNITSITNANVRKMVVEECRECLNKLWVRLESFRPCTALYMGEGRTALDDHPVFCYQHKEAHQQQHRTSEKVSGVPLFSILGLPVRRLWDIYDVWDGGFESNTTVPDEPSEETHRRFFEQTVSYWGAIHSSKGEVYTRFEKLLKAYGVRLHQRYLFYQGPCCFCLQKKSSTSRQIHFQGIMICDDCDRNRTPNVLNDHVQDMVQPVSNENECCICMNPPREVMFSSCNHYRFCKSCAEMMKRRYGRCPLCREEIKDLIVPK